MARKSTVKGRVSTKAQTLPPETCNVAVMQTFNHTRQLRDQCIIFRDQANQQNVLLGDMFTGLRNIMIASLDRFESAVTVPGVDDEAKRLLGDPSYQFTIRTNELTNLLIPAMEWMEENWPRGTEGPLNIWDFTGDKRMTAVNVVESNPTWCSTLMGYLNSIIDVIQ